MMWMQLPNAGQLQKAYRQGFFANIPILEQKFNSCKFFTMASGQVGDETKFYLHSQLADKSGYVIAEAIFKHGMQQVTLTFKTTRGDINDGVKTLFAQALQDFTS